MRAGVRIFSHSASAVGPRSLAATGSNGITRKNHADQADGFFPGVNTLTAEPLRKNARPSAAARTPAAPWGRRNLSPSSSKLFTVVLGGKKRPPPKTSTRYAATDNPLRRHVARTGKRPVCPRVLRPKPLSTGVAQPVHIPSVPGFPRVSRKIAISDTLPG